MKELLDKELFFPDVGKTTFREYFKELLFRLILEEEGFSGKRPFGNSGWKWELYGILVSQGFITGELDEDGDLLDCDCIKGDLILNSMIMEL